MQKRKTALVFGTFDGLHEGHRFFLSEARRHGAYLVAIVAQDNIVKELKDKPPRERLAGRLAKLRASGLVDDACAGDNILGAWSALKKYTPNFIALGYDQEVLAGALAMYIKKRNLPITLIRLPACNPNRLHSRFLQDI